MDLTLGWVMASVKLQVNKQKLCYLKNKEKKALKLTGC